jgi:DNA repair photolyase
MIISASRRTDIPAFYSKWLINRLEAGFVLVTNPMNRKQVSQIALTPDVVDCIVFWTKNPANLIPFLPELTDYNYYFQFTVTPYDSIIERNVPPKELVIATFKRLANLIGPSKVVWRYDPVFITGTYSLDAHIRAFRQLAQQLQGYTEKCIISFLDIYAKTEKNLKGIDYRVLSEQEIMTFAAEITTSARDAHMLIETCAEAYDLLRYGIKKGRCIDTGLIEKISGRTINVGKDKAQRPLCGCANSIDIGSYNTCPHQCLYCYANHSNILVRSTTAVHNDGCPVLCSSLTGDEVIIERTMKSQFVKNSVQAKLV